MYERENERSQALLLWLSFLTLLLMLMAARSAAYAQASPEPVCDELQVQGTKVTYCLDQPPSRANRDLIYFLHPANGDARSWTMYGAEVRRIWAETGTAAPTVITVSIGPFWLLSEQTSSQSDHYRAFVQEVLPAVEERAGGLQGGRRIALGASMGGFNASQLLLKNPELFEKVALFCPAITTISPQSNSGELRAYIERTGADPGLVALLVAIGREYFPTQEDWVRHDPIALARTRLSRDSPALYVSAANRDEYGFFEGTEEFAQIALERTSFVLWVPQEGGHCTFEPQSLAEFLSR